MVDRTQAAAWMTHHDTPMLFPTHDEAATYCRDDDEPIPLFDIRTLADDPAMVERAKEAINAVIIVTDDECDAIAQAVLRAIGGGNG